MIVAIFASDHVVTRQEAFVEVCETMAIVASKGFVVTFGVKRNKPAADYAAVERTQRAAVIPNDIGCSDVGNSDVVWRLSGRDARGSSIYGPRGSSIYGPRE